MTTKQKPGPKSKEEVPVYQYNRLTVSPQNIDHDKVHKMVKAFNEDVGGWCFEYSKKKHTPHYHFYTFAKETLVRDMLKLLYNCKGNKDYKLGFTYPHPETKEITPVDPPDKCSNLICYLVKDGVYKTWGIPDDQLKNGLKKAESYDRSMGINHFKCLCGILDDQIRNIEGGTYFCPEYVTKKVLSYYRENGGFPGNAQFVVMVERLVFEYGYPADIDNFLIKKIEKNYTTS